MDIKKSGYISAILTTIIGIIVFLILEGVIKLDNTSSLINTEIIIMLAIPALLLYFAFSIFSNMEHKIIAAIDTGVAIIFGGILLILLLLKVDDKSLVSNIINYGSYISGSLCIITIPFLTRTQSTLHKYYKYFVTLLILIAILLAFGTINSLKKVQNLEDLESIKNNYAFIKYVAFASFIGIICNPMIGYASSDGLGGGGEDNSPKLVPNNPTNNPNEGINYGPMPVPEGVVANNPNENQSIDSIPINQIEPENILPEGAPEPVQDITSNTNITANEVAPELQFLLNNNDKKN